MGEKVFKAEVLRIQINGDMSLLAHDVKFEKIVICGAARTGTTLLQYMMRAFDRVLVLPGEIPGIASSPLVPFANFIVVFKAPGDVLVIDKILDLWPNTLFLVMKRDPRDTLCSKVRGDYGYKIYKPDYLARLKTCSYYKKKFLEQFPDRVHEICYEELVYDPDIVQKHISDLLRETYSWNFGLYHKIPDVPELNNEYAPPRPVNHRSVGQWRREEHREWMLELIEAAGNELVELTIQEGYEENSSWVEELLKEELT